MTTIHNGPLPDATPFPIYEDREEQELDDGSEISSHSKRTSALPEEILPSIEHDEEDVSEPEPYSSSYTSRPPHLESARSRRASGVTTTSFISSLPSEISIDSKPAVYGNHAFTPLKERPPFRNPSSVRALQMSSPPPFANFESPRERLKGSYRLTTPSRSGRSETPMSAGGSRRSTSHRSGHRKGSQEPMPHHHRTTPTPQQQLPLVLLHVTILPVQAPYPPEVMVKAMPPWLVDNYKLIEEKLQDVVLMQRGLLIPHPNEEYDLLEERILESLELKAPRLLKCGHFNGTSDAADDHEDSEDEDAEVADDEYGRGSRMSGGTITVDEDGEYQATAVGSPDQSVCEECHRQVMKPGKGVGFGKKRWDIKIYAANGLMRAGAWSAAWREMERCDAEISPWIPEETRRSIEKRLEEEEEARKQKMLYEAEVKRLVDAETARVQREEAEAAEQRRFEQEQQRRAEAETLQRQEREEKDEMLRMYLEQTLNDKVEEVKETMRMEFEAQSLFESNAVAKRFRALEEEMKGLQTAVTPQTPLAPEAPPIAELKPEEPQRRQRSVDDTRAREVPLGTLLRNYLVENLGDPKNIALVILIALVAFLAKQVDFSQLKLPSSVAELPSIQPILDVPAVTTSVVVTTTATETALTTTTSIAVATSTVTQMEYHTIKVEQPVISPLSESEQESLIETIAPAEESEQESITENTLASADESEAPSSSEAAATTSLADSDTAPSTEDVPVQETTASSASESSIQAAPKISAPTSVPQPSIFDVVMSLPSDNPMLETTASPPSPEDSAESPLESSANNDDHTSSPPLDALDINTSTCTAIGTQPTSPAIRYPDTFEA